MHDPVDECARVLRVLAHPERTRILMSLRVGFAPARPVQPFALTLRDLATSSNEELLARMRAERASASPEELEVLAVVTVAGRLTVSGRAAELLPANRTSPLYTATRSCAPARRKSRSAGTR